MLVPLDGATAVECEQEICLDDLEGLVAPRGNAKRELLGHLRELGM